MEDPRFLVGAGYEVKHGSGSSRYEGTPGTANDRWGSVLSITFVVRFIPQQHSSFDNNGRQTTVMFHFESGKITEAKHLPNAVDSMHM